MKFEILKYLLDHKFDDDADFTKFLRDTFPQLTREQVRDGLIALSADKLIAGPSEALIQVFTPREDIRRTMQDFPGSIVGWKITSSGERQYFDDEFRNQTRLVNDFVIQASKSSMETNASIKLLNDKIIPKFNTFQRSTSIVTLVVAGLSLLAIAVSAYFSSSSVTSEDIKLLRLQLEKNASTLDSIAHYENGIDSALKAMTGDTSHHSGH